MYRELGQGPNARNQRRAQRVRWIELLGTCAHLHQQRRKLQDKRQGDEGHTCDRAPLCRRDAASEPLLYARETRNVRRRTKATNGCVYKAQAQHQLPREFIEAHRQDDRTDDAERQTEAR